MFSMIKYWYTCKICGKDFWCESERIRQVIQIRDIYIKGSPDCGLDALSKRFNVHRTTIGDIIHHRTWKHIP